MSDLYDCIILEDLGTKVTNIHTGKTRRFLKVKCPVCLTLREATASVVLRTNSTWCKTCKSRLSSSIRASKAGLVFEKTANKIHKNVYDYSTTDYKSSKKKVCIICPIHGEFKQIPNSHLRGHGCPKCSSHGFNKAKPAILYYFKIKNCYKIGVTNRMLESRYNSIDMANISELQVWNFENGEEAFNYEQSILKLFKEFKYTKDTPFTDGTSTSECFNCDIYNIKRGT